MLARRPAAIPMKRKPRKMNQSSSRHFLRHSLWRRLRNFTPAAVWSFLYSIRERILSRHFIGRLRAEIPADRPLSETLLANILLLEGAWKLYGAVGKSESGYGAHYAHIYARLQTIPVLNILEIGVFGGGSHRAWREIFPEAKVYGFDIDPATVVREPRLETFVGDQLSASDMSSLQSDLPRKFELIVDDGWHQPEAGINSLRFFLPSLADGGYYVVEDIDMKKYRKVWVEVARALPAPYLASLVELETPASRSAIGGGGGYGLLIVTTI